MFVGQQRWEPLMDRIIGTIRSIGEEIMQDVVLHRKRDVVLVGAAIVATFTAFIFLVVQTITAVAGSG
jgi:ABC-type enterochelin transport system permease subunit